MNCTGRLSVCRIHRRHDKRENPLETDIREVGGAQRERLAHVDFRLFFIGEVSRADISGRFDVAPAVATRDLARSRALASDNTCFDGSTKTYRATDDFRPAPRDSAARGDTRDHAGSVPRSSRRSIDAGRIRRERLWPGCAGPHRSSDSPGRQVPGVENRDGERVPSPPRGTTGHRDRCYPRAEEHPEELGRSGGASGRNPGTRRSCSRRPGRANSGRCQQRREERSSARSRRWTTKRRTRRDRGVGSLLWSPPRAPRWLAGSRWPDTRRAPGRSQLLPASLRNLWIARSAPDPRSDRTLDGVDSALIASGYVSGGGIGG